MADEATGRIKVPKGLQPDGPFMIYYAPSPTHAPNDPTKEWVDKLRKMKLFGEGWNRPPRTTTKRL